MLRLPPLPSPAPPAEELVRALLVATAFLLLLLAAEGWHRRPTTHEVGTRPLRGRPLGRAGACPPAEWTRKLVHVGGGILAADLPWAVTSPWTVLVLGLLFLAVLRGGHQF